MSPGIVAESDLTGALKSEYVFFDGERVARKDFPGNSISYYFSDHLKTASVITDSAGTIKEDEDYYPWGGELQFVNSDSNHYKFTGKERDSETGLDYFGARYYGNWLGRWMSPDWSSTPVPVPYADLSDPQSLNQYSYVRNIPTSNADADGHECLTQPCAPSANDVKLIFQAAPLWWKAAQLLTTAGPAALLALPSAAAMTFVAVTPPVSNHPGDDSLSASNMMLDALSPGYFPAPPVQQPQTPQLGQGRGAGEEKSQSDVANERARTNGGIATDFHANDHRTEKPAQGYSLRDNDTGEVLKYGETTRGTARYTKQYLKEHNARMVFEAKGTKAQMHKWQHNKIVEYKEQHNGARPPLNRNDY